MYVPHPSIGAKRQGAFVLRAYKMAHCCHELPSCRNAGLFLVLQLIAGVSCILYPQDNSHRLVKELNGLWNFRADFSAGRNQGFHEKWFSKPLEEVSHSLSRIGSILFSTTLLIHLNFSSRALLSPWPFLRASTT